VPGKDPGEALHGIAREAVVLSRVDYITTASAPWPPHSEGDVAEAASTLEFRPGSTIVCPPAR